MKQHSDYAQAIHSYIVANCIWINKNAPELAGIYIEKYYQQFARDIELNTHVVELMISTFLISFSRLDQMVYLTKAAKDEDVTSFLEAVSEQYIELARVMLGEHVAEASIRLGRETALELAEGNKRDEVIAQVATKFFMKEPGPYEDVIDQDLLSQHLVVCLGVFRKFVQSYWDNQDQ